MMDTSNGGRGKKRTDKAAVVKIKLRLPHNQRNGSQEKHGGNITNAAVADGEEDSSDDLKRIK